MTTPTVENIRAVLDEMGATRVESIHLLGWSIGKALLEKVGDNRGALGREIDVACATIRLHFPAGIPPADLEERMTQVRKSIRVGCGLSCDELN